MSPTEQPEPARFFADAAEFAAWLQANHASEPDLWMGLYKKHVPHRGLVWEDAVVEALRFGWIDSRVERIDEDAVRQRWTPRRSGSKWSRINVETAQRLIAEGRMEPAGLAAFESRKDEPAGYSFEGPKNAELPRAYADMMAQSPAATAFWAETTPSYRRICINWVTTAKQQATNDKRMRQLIDDHAAGRMIPSQRYGEPPNGLHGLRRPRERHRVTEPRLNEFAQPIGRPLPWSVARVPEARMFIGHEVRLEPLRPDHAPELFAAFGNAPAMWTYLPAEPPTDVTDMSTIVDSLISPAGRLAFLVRGADGTAQGTLSYCAIQPEIGTIEAGWVAFGPALQRTRASTEAQYLLMKHAFDDLGYRRYEWKCDSLNAASRRAAARLGFVEEGTWRNARVYKGRNRDTTWFSITDEEWPQVRAALERWLSDDNFDAEGRQRMSLRTVGTSAGT